MLKDRLVKWAAKAAIDYLEKHGSELLEDLLAWLIITIENRISGGRVFSAVPPPAGLESYCEAQLNKLRDLEDGNAQ